MGANTMTARRWVWFWILAFVFCTIAGLTAGTYKSQQRPEVSIYDVTLYDSTSVLCAVSKWGDGITCDWDRRK